LGPTAGLNTTVVVRWMSNDLNNVRWMSDDLTCLVVEADDAIDRSMRCGARMRVGAQQRFGSDQKRPL
jgi:hypothetical protein